MYIYLLLLLDPSFSNVSCVVPIDYFRLGAVASVP